MRLANRNTRALSNNKAKQKASAGAEAFLETIGLISLAQFS
jgi:hypothetical protein